MIEKTTDVKQPGNLSSLNTTLRAIEPAISVFRQGMRVGYVPIQWRNFMNVFQNVDTSNRLSVLHGLRTFCMVPYYVYDNLSWLAKLKVIDGDAARLYVLCMTWWLGNVLISIVYDMIVLKEKRELIDSLKKKRTGASADELKDINAQIKATAVELQLLMVNFVKNFADTVLGLSAVKYNYSRTVNGLSGTISSLLGWYLIMPAAKK